MKSSVASSVSNAEGCRGLYGRPGRPLTCDLLPTSASGMGTSGTLQPTLVNKKKARTSCPARLEINVVTGGVPYGTRPLTIRAIVEAIWSIDAVAAVVRCVKAVTRNAKINAKG